LANNVGVVTLMMAYTQAPKMKISSSLKLMKVPCTIDHKESQANPPTSAWWVSANYPYILERLVSLEVQLVKFLISKGRHVV
jgi:hypothetical protein